MKENPLLEEKLRQAYQEGLDLARKLKVEHEQAQQKKDQRGQRRAKEEK